MTVIDLGDVSAEPATPDPAPGPVLLRPIRRRVTTTLVALLCALTLGTSATPGAPLVHETWSIGALEQGSLGVDEDTVYVAGDDGGQPVLTAYDLATGAIRWTRELPADGLGLMAFQVADGMVQLGDTPRVAIGDVPGDDGGTVGVDPVTGEVIAQVHGPTRTVVLDAATGAGRWQAAGEVLHSTPDAVLLGDRSATGEIRTLRLADAHTGAVRWRLPVPGAARWEVEPATGAPERVVTVTGAGEVSVHRFADGELIARRRVDWDGDAQNITTTVQDGRYFVTRTDPRGATVTAYRLADLTRLWSLRTIKSALVSDCAPVLCLALGAEVSGLDPETGAARWLLAEQGGVIEAGPGRVIAHSNAASPVQTLVESATGRVVGTLGPGWPSGPLLIRQSTDDPDRTVLSRMDLATGRITALGTVENTEQSYCVAAGRFLVCQRLDRLVVTAAG
jgi:outer membrane protein assembly factor BamB